VKLLIGNHHVLIDRRDYEKVLPLSRWRIHRQRRSSYVKMRGQDPLGMHRFILGTPAPGFVIDHRNGNGLDNRRANLRCCTPINNSWNARKITPNASGFKGVTKAKRYGWRARITYKGKEYTLGHYRSRISAARAYDSAAVFLFGEFARANLRRVAQAVSPEELRRRAAILIERHCRLRSAGVARRGKRWRAFMQRDRKHIHIGTFATKAEAREAYLRAAGIV
jgi:hypothetical protein